MKVYDEKNKDLTFAPNGILFLPDARRSGLEKNEIYQYRKQHDMERVGHGVYAEKDALVDERYLLHRRCPAAIFSHDEALYFHGLTDQEPISPCLTLYTGYNTKRLNEDGCKVYTVKKELLDVGKTFVKDSFQNEIPMYDLERTLCDIIRSRNKIETSVFATALKEYAKRQDKDLNRLMDYAERFRVAKIVRRYLEVLL